MPFERYTNSRNSRPTEDKGWCVDFHSTQSQPPRLGIWSISATNTHEETAALPKWNPNPRPPELPPAVPPDRHHESKIARKRPILNRCVHHVDLEARVAERSQLMRRTRNKRTCCHILQIERKTPKSGFAPSEGVMLRELGAVAVAKVLFTHHGQETGLERLAHLVRVQSRKHFLRSRDHKRRVRESLAGISPVTTR